VINLVVFSKDRPAQLELLLRSIRTHLAGWQSCPISILYAGDGGRADDGYDVVRYLNPEFRWERENEARSFKQHTLSLVDPQHPLTAFLVDDDVFRAPVSLADAPFRQLADDEEIMAVSLRLDPAMDYCYSEDGPARPPAFESRHVWRWPGAPGDWGYPMSLDGHVFRTEAILPLLEEHEWFNPNSLEDALFRHPLPQPKLCCYSRSRLVNVPANRVQDTAPNRHAGVDAAVLNERFLAGERIALEPFSGLRPRAPHHEVAYAWERRIDDLAPPLAPARDEAPAPVAMAQRRPATVGLLCIATADYLPWAARMVESAKTHFLPGHDVRPFVFSDGHLGPKRVGFPGATLYRYEVFAEHRRWLEQLDYVFYCDADMLFVDTVGDEVLGRLVGTQHPGYVGLRGTYEDRPESRACVLPDEGERYYCGGFNGGEAAAFLDLSEELAARIAEDDANGVLAVWHDESHLNRYFADNAPEVVLSPSYCYPEIVTPNYREAWPEDYVPRLVALDKHHGRFAAAVGDLEARQLGNAA
jgi:glycosyl transferase family 6